jgi:hypothetical protein
LVICIEHGGGKTALTCNLAHFFLKFSYICKTAIMHGLQPIQQSELPRTSELAEDFGWE